jgi:hypothetical protein
MLRLKLSRVFSLVLVVVMTLLITSCTNEFAASMRQLTYPPDFKYTEQDELRTDMAMLALQMQLLENALAKKEEPYSTDAEVQRETVLASLRKISSITSSLKAGDSGANHPFMQDYMSDFGAKVDQARSAASLAKPNYYYAGKGHCQVVAEPHYL